MAQSEMSVVRHQYAQTFVNMMINHLKIVGCIFYVVFFLQNIRSSGHYFWREFSTFVPKEKDKICNFLSVFDFSLKCVALMKYIFIYSCLRILLYPSFIIRIIELLQLIFLQFFQIYPEKMALPPVLMTNWLKKCKMFPG